LPLSPVSYNDLYIFNQTSLKWTQLLGVSGSAPPPLAWMGFAAAPDSKLYIFGGMGSVAGKLFMNCGERSELRVASVSRNRGERFQRRAVKVVMKLG